MVSQSVSTSSRVWSCATFKEGVDQVASSAEQLEAEERELEQQIEATSLHVCFRHQVNLYMVKRLKQLRFVTFCDYFFFHPGTQKSSSSIHYFFHQCHLWSKRILTSIKSPSAHTMQADFAGGITKPKHPWVNPVQMSYIYVNSQQIAT